MTTNDSTLGGDEAAALKARHTRDERHAALVKSNSETFRLSNGGRFPARVSLMFESQLQVRAVNKLNLSDDDRGW